MPKSTQVKIAIFAPYYAHVGTEKVMLTLAQGFVEQGYQVDLLRAYQEWPSFQRKDGISLVDLNAQHLINLWPRLPSYRLWNILLALELLPKLSAYIHRKKPDVLITGLLGAVGILARSLSGAPTKVIVSVQGLPRPSILRRLIWNFTYPHADALVVPSRDITKRLPKAVTNRSQSVRFICNPVVDPCILKCADEPVKHPWFQAGQPPIILGVGRLTRQKDFETLLRAFAIVRKRICSRLVILGEGEKRNELETLARQLNISSSLSMPGFVKNPWKYMSKSAVFVLSSKWEGPGHALIEALGIGVPIVSTECPYGPSEILLGGKLGQLVPVGSPESMASAIVDLLRDPQKAQGFAKKGLEHTTMFHPSSVVREYANLIEKI